MLTSTRAGLEMCTIHLLGVQTIFHTCVVCSLTTIHLSGVQTIFHTCVVCSLTVNRNSLYLWHHDNKVPFKRHQIGQHLHSENGEPNSYLLGFTIVSEGVMVFRF